MPAVKQIYRFDKNSGAVVDVTPEKDKVVIAELTRDTKQIRKRLKRPAYSERASILTSPKPWRSNRRTFHERPNLLDPTE